MEAEAWSSPFPQTHDNLNKSKRESESAAFNHNRNYHRSLKVMKTEMCKRFMRSECIHGSICRYAHSIAELRHQPKLCRFFLQNKHCPYGRNCRFPHSTTLPPFNPNPQPLQPESERMQTTSAAASTSSDGYSSAEHGIMQTSAAAAAATNASTSSSHKNEPSYPVKFIFKNNDLQKINRIYGDWID